MAYETDLDVIVKRFDGLRFHFDALETLTLKLLDSLYHVVHLALYDGELRAGADTGIRSHRQEVVREAVNADRHIALRVGCPFLLKGDTSPAVDGNAQLEGIIVTWVHEIEWKVKIAGNPPTSRTDENVEVLLVSVDSFNPFLRHSLDQS